MRILYTSDIHANPHHLYAMLNIAEKEAVDVVIVGGDIVPHYLPDADTVGVLQAQALYLKNIFMPAIKNFKERRPIAIYLDLANDDFVYNREILKDLNLGLIKLLHMRKYMLSDHVDIIGYMIVPPTPFYRKDWEKPDTPDAPFAKGNIVALDGYSSASGNLVETVIDLTSDDTIENDLARLSESIDRPFIFVAHSPPYQTPLDVLDNGLHVGSISIRRFIEDWSRRGLLIASLHGHIHGAPARSGTIHTTIENTVCINPGQNEGIRSLLRYVIMELDDQPTPPRIRITYEP
ncbi:MAG: metallophosphoesterase [Proteobacteria bacterium]|nr:metallophosphoesterase [Pseudomonadota bacterium]